MNTKIGTSRKITQNTDTEFKGTKPYSAACERNQAPILNVLKGVLASNRRVLEIGSGTGQHAVYFAKSLTHLVWHTSDLPENHQGIRAWIAESGLDNVLLPIELDVNMNAWEIGSFDAVFSANILHLISWTEIQRLFERIENILEPQGVLCIYGPFHYNGIPTSESNAQFDVYLKRLNPLNGIRDFEAINTLAHELGLTLEKDYAMPFNNRLLVWQKSR